MVTTLSTGQNLRTFPGTIHDLCNFFEDNVVDSSVVHKHRLPAIWPTTTLSLAGYFPQIIHEIQKGKYRSAIKVGRLLSKNISLLFSSGQHWDSSRL